MKGNQTFHDALVSFAERRVIKMKQTEQLVSGETMILASGSPRRKELLTQAGFTYEVIVSDVEEKITATIPSQVVMELAEQKASDVASKIEEGVIIGADTVVASGETILGKPTDDEDAFSMLKALSGSIHSVFTGVCILSKKEGMIVDKRVFYEETKVEMYPLEDQEIKEYIKSKEPQDKAGAYAIQGKAAIFIKGIQGDYYNVVGLPIGRLVKELKQLQK